MKTRNCCILEQRDLNGAANLDQEKRLRMRVQLLRQFKELLAQGVTHFISGLVPGIESDAVQLLLALKEQYPHLTIECVIAHEQQHVDWSIRQQEKYFELVARCDFETMLQTQFSPDALAKRDRYLIRQSSHTVFVGEQSNQGLNELMRYAYALDKKVILLPEAVEEQQSYLRLIK